MSNNVIDFCAYHRPQQGRPTALVWVPENRGKWVDGHGVYYWTGREVLCRLVPNPDYRGPVKFASASNIDQQTPFEYVEIKDKNWLSIYRSATPPPCGVDEFDWETFEREACRS